MKANNHHLFIINQANYQPTLAYQPSKIPTNTCLSTTKKATNLQLFIT
jgi:hypothetical protein